MPELNQVFSNRYEIVRHVARGGMAEVFLARDMSLDRSVALKVLFPELSADPSFVERFRREAQAAANLNHPNIVSVFDWGEEGGTYFIVMEYVDGPTLRDLVRAEGRLDARRAAAFAADVAGALSFAHRNGVIHRDVKPGNVLITTTGQVKVTDFGIARAARDAAGENLTQTGTVMGTATYFSPEQAQGLPIDPRSDVYSLGVVLYELLAGAPPFAGENAVAIAYRHVREEPALLRSVNPDVPEDLEAIVWKALAKRPEDRYATAEALRNDLLRFWHGQRVEAPPVVAAATTQVATAVGGGATQVATTVGPMTAGAPAYAPAAPVSTRRTGAYAALLGVLLLVLAGLLFLLYQQLSDDNGAAATVTVPRVLEQPQADAVRILEEQGLRAVTTEAPTDTVEPGVVFGQDPAPGRTVEEGSEVRLTVAAGAGSVVVPNVVDRALEDARSVLEERGLEVSVVNAPSDAAEPGTVLDQDPEPGNEVASGSTVTLTVSSGREQVDVPDVRGLTSEQAAARLGRAGFDVARETEPSTTVTQGDVVRTDPAPGTKAERGSTVTIVVSSGPPTTTTTASTATVPDVTSLPQSVAESRIARAGFTSTATTVDATDPRCAPQRDGIVVAQDPEGGTTAPEGTTVTLTVCRAS